jgi:hypothetical protein
MKSTYALALFTIAALGLMSAGCQHEEAQLVTPETDTYTPQFVALPSSPAMHKTFESSSTISVQNGGVLSINAHDPDDPLTIFYSISLTFEPASVQNDITASVRTDTEILMYEFEPHGTAFNSPAKFSAKFGGLNLSWITPGSTVSLWYEGPNGWTKMKGTVTYDIAAGTLQCLDGELPHFSRYGFGI